MALQRDFLEAAQLRRRRSRHARSALAAAFLVTVVSLACFAAYKAFEAESRRVGGLAPPPRAHACACGSDSTPI